MPHPKPFMQLVIEADELAATKQLLDHADRLLGDLRFIERDVHALTAVLATGVEKLLKLTYGLTAAHIDGEWPASKVRGFGHRVRDLHAECRALLLDRESSATNRGVVTAARAELDSDAWLAGVLGILQRYATTGRFYNLDYLGQEPHVEPSPRELWHELDHETWAADPRVPSSPSEDDTFHANERRRADAWQTSLRRWRWYYYQCWVQNMCGPEARQYAHEIRGIEPMH